jgi:hypothetical protein
MTGRSKRTTALLNSGTLSPNPWDLSLSGQNGWPYTEGTRTEDKAPQGCDLSAASSAGMAGGGVDPDAPPNQHQDPSNFNLLRAQNGLDNGVHRRLRKDKDQLIETTWLRACQLALKDSSQARDGNCKITTIAPPLSKNRPGQPVESQSW